MLHAQRLTLTHPVTGAPLCIEAPLPGDFAAALGALLPAFPLGGAAGAENSP